jgi:L-threonylcarbamoyladenylate synthase
MMRISTAAAILREGGLVAIPTETVYGLAADAFSRKAF